MIEVIRRPYNISFSGNPIVYELYEPDAIANKDMNIEVQILFRRSDSRPYNEPGAPAHTPIVTVVQTPVDGIVVIDLSDILQSRLDYYIPDLQQQIQFTGKQMGEYMVYFRSVTPENSNPPWITTEIPHKVVKGGISTYTWYFNNFFETFLTTTKPFFSWQVTRRLASLTERIYLCWLNLNYDAVQQVKLRTIVVYTDESSTTLDINLPFPLFNFYDNFYYLPGGATQLGLPALNPPKTIWYWEVFLVDAAETPVTERRRFENDQRNDYNQVTLIYRNSLGGLDSLRLRGVIETNIAIDGQDVEVAASADWVFTNKNPARFNKGLPAREIVSFKADAGYLGKEEQDRMRDMFITRELYTEVNGRLWPVAILTKQYRLTGSQDKLFSLPLEFTVADGGSFSYTPAAINLGTGSESLGVCGATIAFVDHSEEDIGGGAVRVRINYLVTGAPPNLQYRFPNFDETWHTVAFDAGNQQFTFDMPGGYSRTMEMRTECADGSVGVSAYYTVDVGLPGTPNSLIRNSLAGLPITFVLTRNGFLIASGVIAVGGYEPFFCPTGSGNFTLTMTAALPNLAVMTVGPNEFPVERQSDQNFFEWFTIGTGSEGMNIDVQ